MTFCASPSHTRLAELVEAMLACSVHKGKSVLRQAQHGGYFFGLLATVLVAIPAHAQTVTSDQVSDVSVTIYRDPYRGNGPFYAAWPGGYALISETRTITIPAGDAVIRFEGVAEGMLPESALVSGLPSDVKEKNRDARLLSPTGLVDAFLKRRVHLVRTSLVGGKRVEQDAVITAGPSGGVLVQTADGTEALGCSGLPERMRYDNVPEGLSAKPTLSVMTRSKKAQRVTVTLTYIAQGFDWSAHYVATTDMDADKMQLLAWATLVNGGAQSFPHARVQLIAGKANYAAKAGLGQERAVPLKLQCWPMDNTATHPVLTFQRLPFYAAPTEEIDLVAWEKPRLRGRYDMMPVPSPVMMMSPPPPPPPPAPAMIATQENFGDLKLYRIPERVTVAAQASKQVAMINQKDVVIARRYFIDAPYAGQSFPAQVRLEMTNTKAQGLGLPLPSGAITTSETIDDNPLFTGEAALRDYAVGEDVWYVVGRSTLVSAKLTETARSQENASYSVAIANAYAEAVPVELTLQGRPDEISEGMAQRNGRWTIRLMVPGNDTTEIRYQVKLR